ncbi:hypothetical protein [Spirosoma sp.]|uniref:hypothetical protein n=1 Tax=Spirosoma sp. TaxID=1899569 RepID=UPI003B3A4934
MGQGVQGLSKLLEGKVRGLFLAYGLFELKAFHKHLELLIGGGRVNPVLAVEFGNTSQVSLNGEEAAGSSQEGDVFHQGNS